MMLRIAKIASIASLWLVCSCGQEKCEEPAPTLEFVRYKYQPKPANVSTVSDTLTIVTRFTDCQGDVGSEDPEDKNLRTYLYEKINGQWQRYYPPDSVDSVAFFANIPYSKKVKQGVKVEGLLEQRFGAVRQNSDTIRFETYIIDREGNKSNRVLTPDTIIPN
ncbi:MAG: hypothetical protein Kow0075_01460 [Salibacteraceae bacterium]